MSNELFPISYWSGPSAKRERYAEIAEAGFNVAQVRATGEADALQVLDWCQELGIKAVVADRRIRSGMTEDADWEAAVDAVVAAYGGHVALWGYYVTDEPHLREFDGLAQIVRAFGERDPERVAYINLYPNYASPDQLGTVSYAAHVRAYMDTVRPVLLSYDNYSLLETGDRPHYFTNLEIIRREALRAGTPFMNIILATPHFNYRDPSAPDMRWQVYTSLAYGAKALAYFTYKTPDLENYRNGPLSIYEKRTAKWDIVRDLNLELQALAPHLLGLRSTGVWHWPDLPVVAQAETRCLCGAGVVARIEGGSYLVGEFEDADGYPWVMVVNRDRERSSFAKVTLRTTHRTVEEVARSTGDLRPVARDLGVPATGAYADGMITAFWLAPGDGRLMKLSG